MKYYQAETTAAYYRPIIAGFIGSLRARAGWIDGYGGDEVRLSDRFFEGASSFRGFEVAGVGPRFIQGLNSDGNLDGQSLGGNAYAIGTAEVLIPVPLPAEYGIRVSLFTDFGAVGLVDDGAKRLNDPMFADLLLENIPLFPNTNGELDLLPIQDDFSLRASAGVSISWNSPFGPVRFDFAEVLMKEEYDQTEGFRFSAGTNF